MILVAMRDDAGIIIHYIFIYLFIKDHGKNFNKNTDKNTDKEYDKNVDESFHKNIENFYKNLNNEFGDIELNVIKYIVLTKKMYNQTLSWEQSDQETFTWMKIVLFLVYFRNNFDKKHINIDKKLNIFDKFSRINFDEKLNKYLVKNFNKFNDVLSVSEILYLNYIVALIYKKKYLQTILTKFSNSHCSGSFLDVQFF